MLLRLMAIFGQMHLNSIITHPTCLTQHESSERLARMLYRDGYIEYLDDIQRMPGYHTKNERFEYH